VVEEALEDNCAIATDRLVNSSTVAQLPRQLEATRAPSRRRRPTLATPGQTGLSLGAHRRMPLRGRRGVSNPAQRSGFLGAVSSVAPRKRSQHH
jgi:hypothetical protein